MLSDMHCMPANASAEDIPFASVHGEKESDEAFLHTLQALAGGVTQDPPNPEPVMNHSFELDSDCIRKVCPSPAGMAFGAVTHCGRSTYSEMEAVRQLDHAALHVTGCELSSDGAWVCPPAGRPPLPGCWRQSGAHWTLGRGQGTDTHVLRSNPQMWSCCQAKW